MKSKRTPIKHSKKAISRTDDNLNYVLKSSFLGILFTFGISLALLFASTAAAIMTDDPTLFAEYIGYAATFLSAFAGGFICSKIAKQSPYLVGILTGLGFVIVSMLFSFILPHSLASGMNIWMRLALHTLSLLCFPIGTLIGVKASKPKRKPKKRR